MQAVAALAAENANREVDRHVVRVLARNADVADAHLRLHRVRLVDDDHAPRRFGRIDEGLRRQIAPLPVAEDLLRGRERFLGRDVADEREDCVVRQEVPRVEREEIVARDRGDCRRRAVLRHAVRMETVDETIEDGVGHVAGIVRAHLQPRQHLLPLPLDLARREAGVPHHVGQDPHPGLEAVLHDDHVAERQVGAGAGAHRGADEVDFVVDLLRRLRRRALIEERRSEVREPQLVPRIRGRAGANEQPHRHGRLLVLQHGDDLQAVRERLDLIGGELDLPRRERAWGSLRGPLTGLGLRAAKDTEEENRGHRERHKG